MTPFEAVVPRQNTGMGRTMKKEERREMKEKEWGGVGIGRRIFALLDRLSLELSNSVEPIQYTS